MSLLRVSFHRLALVASCAAILALASSARGQDAGRIDSNDVKELFSPNGFNDHRRSAVPVTLPANVDIEAIRQSLSSASRDAHTLYHELRAQEAGVPGLLQYTGNLLRLQVNAESLAERITNRRELERHLADLQQLDAQWRQLSYDLGLLPGLDRQSLALIRQLDQTSDQITARLKIGQSVDYRDLVMKTSGLASAVDRLIQDLDYVVGRTSEGRQLITQGQTVKQQAAHVAGGAFQRFEHDHLVSDFKLFQDSWSSYLNKLRRLRDPLIDKDVQNINAFEREVSSLLRMEQTLDRSQLIYLVGQLTRDVDAFFSKAPLKMLMRLPDADRALSTADAFYGNFENFVDVANRGANRADLQYTFAFIDEAWQDFARVYRPLQSAEAQQVLSAIEKDVTVLREALLIQEDVNRRKASELASKVATLAMFIERDTENWLRKARVPNASHIQQEVARYRESADDLHAAISGGASLREIRQLCDATFDGWRRVYEHIINCRTSERASLAASSSQTTPALIELRTVFGQ